MVAINHNVWGWAYATGVSVLERTYASSLEALISQRFNIYAQFEAFRRGEISDAYDPENGELHPATGWEHELKCIDESEQALRQAIMVMLYHFWEKQISRWNGGAVQREKAESHHDACVRYCKENGLIVADELDHLRLLVNFLKHDQGEKDWADLLFGQREDLFPKSAGTDDPNDYLCVSHEAVEGFFRAVRQAGPNAESDFNPSP